MRTLNHFFMLLFVPCMGLTMLHGQVKVGNNPGTIDANSLFELESTNKGFLPPRMALNSVSSTSPLTAPVPVGMTVFSTGGTLTDGYYYWNGSSWVPNSGSGRLNYVLVKSASDFPAPVSGVITLAANTLYEVNGTVYLTSKINLNNSWLRGANSVYDKLVYTPASGELFTGTAGGNIRNLTLSAPTAGAKLFNLDAAGANVNLIMENSYIGGCNNIGNIKGFGGVVYVQTVAFVGNTNGITYENDTNLVLMNTLWDKSNYNTYEKLVGTFGLIQKDNGVMATSSTNSATALDVSGLTSVHLAELKAVLFAGDGTYKNGSFAKQWEVESSGLQSEKDDVASGNLYISSTGTTVISTMNTPYKVTGTTTAVSLFRVTSPSSNRLTYAGTKSRRFFVNCALTAQFVSSSGNKYFSFYIAKNGTVLTESKQKVKLISNTDQTSVSLSCTINMSPNDYIEVWVENNTDATDIAIQTMNLAIR